MPEVNVFGIHLLGLDAHTAVKLGLTIALLLGFGVLRRVLRAATRTAVPPTRAARVSFWLRQIVSVALMVALVVSLTAVWFDNPSRLATVAGLLSAGVAFALQRVITSVAGYVVILRGSTFSVGDRIVMGSVRGDVIALDPFQTTIMEMGEARGEQADAPALWIHGRQFTGRIVTVTNGVIFDQPVYNYTRDFPYIWDEIALPIPYDGDDARAERIMLDAVREFAVSADAVAADAKVRLQQRYGLELPEIAPRSFYRLTDNWIEIAVRFLVHDHGPRAAKDAMYRRILAQFRAAGIEVASGTYAIVAVPPLHVELPPDRRPA
jgi:small-conductance mechanosensitive channel